MASLARDVYLAVRCTAFMTPWLAHLFVADILLSALLPVAAVAPSLAYNLSSNIAASVWHGIQYIFTGFNRAQITVSGLEAIPSGESAIIVANHVEWTDFYMIQELAIRSGMLGRCRYFAKQQLKWVPFLGWGLWAMGMPLVSRKWMVDQREMDRVFYGIVQRKWPVWLIAYSEATRFTPAKRREAEKWCKENNKPLGDHVLYPRTKGFVASVQQLRRTTHVKAVYDVTIAYAKDGKLFQVSPSFLQTVLDWDLDKNWRFYVHVDRHEISKLPTSDEALAKWLEQRWVAKGHRLENLKQQVAENITWSGDKVDAKKLK